MTGASRRAGLVVLGLVLAVCERETPAPGPRKAADAAAAATAARAAVPPAVPQIPPAAEGLVAEEREADPASDAVTATLSVSPPARAVVLWGRRRLGALRPGAMTLAVTRPRGSGPLDVTIRAEGFLPYHVRLFTDRDDRLSVRLVRPRDAASLLGYRPPRP